MSKKILILDTNIMCCWLKVPGKDTAGTAEDRWDYDRINSIITEEIDKGNILVLPLATLVETGNHVANSSSNRYNIAKSFAEYIFNAAQGNSPWAIFTDQTILWNKEKLIELSKTWPDLAISGLSLADATIKDVAESYAAAGFHVEILTADAGLKAYEPLKPLVKPRRR
jgi:hypothetical protein